MLGLLLVGIPDCGGNSLCGIDHKLTKITVNIHSIGDEHPEEMNTLKHWLESNGYINIAEGGGDNSINVKGRGKKWWAMSYERKLDDEATEEDLDSSAEITDPNPVP